VRRVGGGHNSSPIRNKEAPTLHMVNAHFSAIAVAGHVFRRSLAFISAVGTRECPKRVKFVPEKTHEWARALSPHEPRIPLTGRDSHPQDNKQDFRRSAASLPPDQPSLVAPNHSVFRLSVRRRSMRNSIGATLPRRSSNRKNTKADGIHRRDRRQHPRWGHESRKMI
jgi:hypothetical protein